MRHRRMAFIILGGTVSILVVGFLTALISDRTGHVVPPGGPSPKEDASTPIVEIPAAGIMDRSIRQIQQDYGHLAVDFHRLTAAGKRAIYGFYIKGTRVHVQVDVDLKTGRAIYIGYSFAEQPLPEAAAWKTVGYERPRIPPTGPKAPILTNPTRVDIWDDVPEIRPFGAIILVYTDATKTRVGKISFSKWPLRNSISP